MGVSFLYHVSLEDHRAIGLEDHQVIGLGGT